MKQIRKIIVLLFALTILVTSVTGCQKKEAAECPFTTITWGNTLEDIIDLEGESKDTYDSTYKGTTYTYDKEYLGLDGTIKYMFDDKDKLVSIAWMYVSDDAEDVKDVYEKVHTEAESALGESNYQKDMKGNELNSKLQDSQEELNAAGMSTPFTDIWRQEDGNVILSAVLTSDTKAVQYTFLHPDVSQK